MFPRLGPMSMLFDDFKSWPDGRGQRWLLSTTTCFWSLGHTMEVEDICDIYGAAPPKELMGCKFLDMT